MAEKKQSRVLAEAAAKAGLSEVEFNSVRDWLAAQLEANQYAKLGQGGHTIGEVPLTQVFVDLPVSTTPEINSPQNQEYFLTKIHEPDITNTNFWLGDDSKAHFITHLLIGGPGQGKSTLVQIASQLHRVALLNPLSAQLRQEQQKLLCSFSIKQAEGNTTLALPKNPLLPLQIALPEFSAWITTAKIDTQTPVLLQFLASQATAQDCGLQVTTLAKLLTAMPWLLIADGFDEVGAGADRFKIVDALDELTTTPSTCHKTCTTIITTRPQGYTDEFAKFGANKQYLIPLSQQQALGYAEKLITNRHKDATERQKQMQRMQLAAQEAATARLLTSPLQITILTSLLEKIGRAPRERWALFHRYFSHIYEREIERNTYASPLLRDYRIYVEQIHQRVGLLLQVEAEQSGGAAARITRDRLREVISQVLSDAEVAEPELQSLAQQIAIATEQRLVFLDEQESGKFGFEIRSLQEFMAAWALTMGEDEHIKNRLHQIARAPMFENTLLFATSRLFAEGSHLRGFVATQLCPGLNEDRSNPVFGLTNAGARLALTILDEGSVLSQPKYSKVLMQYACGIMTSPPVERQRELCNLLSRDTENEFESALQSALNGPQPLSAWLCLLLAINAGFTWVERLADQYWDKLTDYSALLTLCKQREIPMGLWLAQKLDQHANDILPSAFIGVHVTEETARTHWAAWITLIASPISVFNFEKFHKIKNISHLPPPGMPYPKSWAAWVFSCQYELAPSAKSLADTLVEIAKNGKQGEWITLADYFSWPLAVCLKCCESNADLHFVANALHNEEMGDFQDWHKASKRVDGKILAHLNNTPTDLPWNLATLAYGLPLLVYHPFDFAILGSHMTQTTLTEIERTFTTNRFTSVKQFIAKTALRILAKTHADTKQIPHDWRTWLAMNRDEIALFFEQPEWLKLDEWKQLLIDHNDLELFSEFLYFEQYENALQIADRFLVALRFIIFRFDFLEHWLSNNHSTGDQPPILAIKTAQTPLSDTVEWAIFALYFDVLPNDRLNRIHLEIIAAAEKIPALLPAFLKALRNGKRPKTQTQPILLRTYEALAPSHPEYRNVFRALLDLLQSEKSNLDQESTWHQLALPLPCPQTSQASDQAEYIPTQPITLQALELQDARRFQQIKFDFSRPANTTEGQWVVILGPNGAGKTTLLRAIAIALRNIKDPNIWPANSFDGWARLGQSEQRTSETHILVTVNGKQHKTTIRINGNHYYYQDPPQTRPHLLPLFAYGCRRGSALGGASTMVKLGDSGGPEIATLFDEGADLIQAETWLKELDGDAAKNQRSAQIFAAVADALEKLLGVHALEVRDKIVWISDHNGVRMPLRYLSDGYLTTAGWFLDLIARWIDLCERYEVVISTNFMQHMRGLVLIDEIDLHLHPRFQIDIIARTRKLLPQMSFVVTTHNPLTLIGAKAQEIWVLSDEDGRTKVQAGVETPALLTGSELYLSYFGINDYFPGELGQAFQRYAVLCNDIMRSDEEDAELYRLQAQLKAADMLPPYPIAARYAPTHEPAPASTQASALVPEAKKRSRKKTEPNP